MGEIADIFKKNVQELSQLLWQEREKAFNDAVHGNGCACCKQRTHPEALYIYETKPLIDTENNIHIKFIIVCMHCYKKFDTKIQTLIEKYNNGD